MATAGSGFERHGNILRIAGCLWQAAFTYKCRIGCNCFFIYINTWLRRITRALEIILKKYLWRAFFTERYENSTASRAYGDYKILKAYFANKVKEDGEYYRLEETPIFSSEYEIVTIEELKVVKWPKGENVLGRAILAVSNYLGAYDFADGQKVSREHLKKREYHHIYPDALLKEAGLESFLALNCALITNTTNRTIGRKDPLIYLKERYEWTTEDIVNQRLKVI